MPWSFYDKNGNLKQAAAGVVTPAAKAYSTTATSIANNGNTVVPMATALFDTTGMFSSNRFNIAAAGKYLVTLHAVFAANGNGSRGLGIRKNGVSDVLFARGPIKDASNDSGVVYSGVVDLVAGDYVEMIAYQNTGGALALGASLPIEGAVNASAVMEVVKIDGSVDRPVAYPAALVGQEMAYVEQPTTITGGAGTDIVDATFVADGVSSYIVETFVSNAIGPTAGNGYGLALYLDGVEQSVMYQWHESNANYRTDLGVARRRVTPSAGSHTFSLKVAAGVGSLTVESSSTATGFGGAPNAPVYIRITKAS